MKRLLSSCCLVAFLAAACGDRQGEVAEQPSQDRNAALEAAFEQLERDEAPVVVAVSLDGEPAHVREFGSLRADGVAAEQALVDIGSITKTVTGVAISKLVEQGRLRLDETLTEILPGVPADKAKITVEQLLTHTGGLSEAIGDDAEEIDRGEFLRRALASEMVGVPGTRYAYSNVGYSILAAIIELRSGRSYEEYLHAELLVPAGLDGIGYLSAYDDARTLRAPNGEGVFEASWGGHDASWHLIGNGGLVTTAGTFVEFLQALADGRILTASSLERVREPRVAEDDTGTSFYGYGVVVQDLPQLGRVYWHDGGNIVFSAEWSAMVDHGDVMFVAGVDAGGEEGMASAAMSVLRDHLYR
ncbi:serine hydrolase domain-containing protein [Mycolicibacterium arenosum]|uniref:Beta-lactamase family protein n=1 Tax=Mycolicibacterium arenosum TaxID=2952157 RepID=A0ABT1LXE5_9MYCO|nr:serine hydrolase [Mycolicibacterium sp. CAU 1645]MCP9271564.1 beta-lactamase family protein [Mycolicibacterium sp. CAU 1645]